MCQADAWPTALPRSRHTAIWPDPDGALRASLGGARLVIVRPDRIVAATALDPHLLARYARALGVAPSAL